MSIRGLGNVGKVSTSVGTISTITGSEGLIYGSSAATFDFAASGIVFQVSKAGLVTLTIAHGVITAQDYLNNQNLGVSTPGTTLWTNNLTVTVPDNSMWANRGETVFFSPQWTQEATALQPFTFGNALVLCTVDDSGNVGVDSLWGTASLSPGQTNPYPTVEVETLRTISVRVVGVVPNGYSNSTQPFDFTGNCNAFQEVYVKPTWAFVYAQVSCEVDGQTGEVTVDSIFAENEELGPGQINPYPTVSTPQPRTISVRITGTVRAEFADAGTQYDLVGDCNTTQPAFTIEGFAERDWTGSISVSPTGTVLTENGNVGSVTSVPASFDSNLTDNPRDAVFSNVTLIGIPPGYPNSGPTNTISFARVVSQPSNLPEFLASDWTGVVQVAQNGGITATVGNAGPISIITSPFDPNDTFDPIQRDVVVEVTITSGFRFTGQTKRITRAVDQPGADEPEFRTIVFQTDLADNSTVAPASLTFEAPTGSAVQGEFLVSPTDTDGRTWRFTNRNQISTTSTHPVLATGLQNLDAFGNMVIVVSGVAGDGTQFVTMFVSGGPEFVLGADQDQIFPITGTTDVTGYASGSATGAITYSWSLSGFGATLSNANQQTCRLTRFAAGAMTLSLTITRGGYSSTRIQHITSQ